MIDELKVKLGKHLEQDATIDESTKEQIIAELDCLANLIIDCYLEKKS